MNDAKLFLMRIRVYNSMINEKLDEINHLRDMVTRITGSYSTNPGGSGNNDKLGNTIAKICDMEEELNHDIDMYVDSRNMAQKLIDQVQDPDQHDVLYKRYFEFKKWEQIACEMGFTYRWILKIHGRALQSVDQILKERKKH